MQAPNCVLFQNNIVYVDQFNAYCNLCKSTLQRRNIIVHTETYGHQKKIEHINDLIEGEFIDFPSTNRSAYCTICQCTIGFYYRTINEHITGMHHLENKSQALRPLNGIISIQDNDEEVWCKVCKTDLDICDILDHVDSDDHREVLEELESYEDEGICLAQYLSTYTLGAWCSYCKCYVPANENNLDQHVDGFRHRRLHPAEREDTDSDVDESEYYDSSEY